MSEADKVTIVIIEDHRLMVEGLASLIHEQDDLRVVGVAFTVAEGIETVDTTRPDVVLIDSWLPDGSGAEATERIRRDHPDIAVVLLSADVSEAAISKAVEAGACGWVSKAACAEQLLDAIRRAAHR
jgi:DNA-binding NarL/FixJ family response regulator